MFQRMTVKSRLTLLVGLLLLTMSMIGLASMLTMRASADALKAVLDRRVTPLTQLSEIGAQVQTSALLILDTGTNMNEQTFTDNLKGIRDGNARIDQLWKAYLDGAMESDERALAVQAQQASERFRRDVVNPALDAMGRKFDTNALGVLLALAPQVKQGLDQVQGKLSILQEFEARKTREEFAAVRMRSITTTVAIVALSLFGGGGAIAFALFITRRLNAELGGEPRLAAEVARRMAAGDLDHDIPVEPDDDNSLMRAMHTMRASFQDFATAQTEMARAHEAGRIAHRMPEEHFPGIYGKMAVAVNEMVQLHLQTTMHVVEAVSRYAHGDFTAEMAALPGDMSRISDSVGEIRSSLLAINREIELLVEAALHGDLSARGSVDRYEHGFHAMVSGANQLMEICDASSRDVAELLEALAQGDLTCRIDNAFEGRFASLRDDANATVGRLTEIVCGIRDTTAIINTAAEEIARGNDDLSRRTEEQAAGLEHVAGRMARLTETTRINSANARQANQLTQHAAQLAVSGGKVVQQVVRTMGQIETSSRRIVDIIAVIDGIAFQTNILALNASVEAARAGEQGRGFAVVASEVRNLAQRSAAAAREIKDLIGDSVAQVDGGGRLAGEAGRSMEEIVDSIRDVNAFMASISAASTEQNQAIEEVERIIQQMDGATQQNSALVEQAAAAAGSMEQQARTLTRAVSAFRLSTGQDRNRRRLLLAS